MVVYLHDCSFVDSRVCSAVLLILRTGFFIIFLILVYVPLLRFHFFIFLHFFPRVSVLFLLHLEF